MNYVVAICLIYMLVLFISILIKIITLKAENKLEYVKSFKKGKFTLIYFVAVPLYWIGLVYKGIPLGEAVLNAIKSSVELVVLKYDYNSVALLMGENVFYRITMDICFSLVAINAIMFALSLVYREIANKIRLFKALHISKKVYVFVGCGESNKKIIKTINKKECATLIFADKNEEISDFAFIEKVAFVKSLSENNFATILCKYFKRFDNKTVNVIINTEDDKKNIAYTEQVSEVIIKLDLTKYSIDDSRGLNAYAFGEPENDSLFLHFLESTNGCIHYINKYKLVAMDFVDRYPLTAFMTDKHIDYSSASIKDDVSINVIMIGFGKTNQQIFLTSVSNNQFVSIRNGEIVDKPVNYWIYDKKDSQNDKNLNHNYYRYLNEVGNEKKDYLPLPPKPANEHFYEIDINSCDFYRSIRNNLLEENGQHVFNYIIVAYGTDVENLDFSEKIITKINEWGISEDTKVFCKIRDKILNSQVFNKEFASNNFFTFGNESEEVYSISKIVSEKNEQMAKDRHLCYALEGVDEADEEIVKAKALKKWYAQSQVQRESNTYACLSIRLKLNLLGFDYCSKEDDRVSAETEFKELYENGDSIIYDDTKPAVKGHKIVKYSNDIKDGSIRYIMAVQEHQRWTAYMITSGFVPSTIKEISEGNVKNMKLRRHGNITTFDGLYKFREIMAKSMGTSEEKTDVIRYDYQIMDDVVWILSDNGYKIVKKTNY